MSENLKDPNKAAHDIAEVLEDGGAIRNDGERLKAANKNPWYVLATIYGEQEKAAELGVYDEELAGKNRRAWNGWFCHKLNEKERRDRAEATGMKLEDLAPHSKVELQELREKLRARLEDDTAELPDPAKSIYFSKTYFSKPVVFEKYIFEEDAEFGGSCFDKVSSFSDAYFHKHAFFPDVHFHGTLYFRNTDFHGVSFFVGSHFHRRAIFNGTHFCGQSYFRESHFQGVSLFRNVQFDHKADFSSTKFKSTTRFADARFLSCVPKFHAAEIYDDTLFPTKAEDVGNWPPLSATVELEGQEYPVAVMDAEDQKRAYNRLRLFMNRSLQIDEEQFFHRQEMRCKREMAVGVHKWIYWAFEKISDFGISVKRPMVGLVASIVIGAAVLALYLGMHGRVADGAVFWESLGWSVSNSVPFLGYGKLYYGAGYVEGFHWGIKAMAGVQTFAGYVLLFLLGLGLRNRFRLR